MGQDLPLTARILIFLPIPNSGLAKVIVHVPPHVVPHSPGSSAPGRQSASQHLPSQDGMPLYRCPTLQRAPQTLTLAGFTGPDILRSGRPGSINPTREGALSLKQATAFKWQLRSHVMATAHLLWNLLYFSNAPKNKWATGNHVDLEIGFFLGL